MRHRRGGATAAGLLGLAAFWLSAAAAAAAADIPGGKGTQAVMRPGLEGVEGALDRRGDSDWYRVALKAGRNYAFQVSADANCAVLRLRKLDGTVVARTFGGASDVGDGGFEIRPTRDATYFAEFKDGMSDGFCFAEVYPSDYRGTVGVDARGDNSTVSTIAPGQTIDGLLNWSGDQDFFRARLDAARSYTLSFRAGSDSGFRLQDAKGGVIARGSVDGGGDTPETIAGIRVPASGTYYVVAAGQGEFRTDYRLGLSSP